MPVNVVRTPEEEIAWERAKARAHEEYPDATGDRFYRIVMAIYKKMAHYEPRTRPSEFEEISMNKGIARSMDRRGSRSDKTPPVAQKQKFSDPSICDRCGAVYSGKSWRRGPRLAREVIDKAPWVTCPGCAQAAAGEYHGQVLITVGDSASLEAVSARIANVERRAQFTQPERRVVSTNWNGKTLEVLTTSQKLAHRIAREVEKAFAGRARFSWSDDDGSLLAAVELGRPHAKAKSK